MNMLARARPDLLVMQGYSSARMEASGGCVLLNANESPWDSLSAASGGLNRYPDPQPAALRSRLAALYAVPEHAVLVGRGSDEAIDLLVRSFCRADRDNVLVCPPTFGIYAVSAQVQGARVLRVPLGAAPEFAFDVDAVLSAIDEQTRIVFACSPNNPTGGVIPARDLLRLGEALQGRALLIVDEAYIEFSSAESLALLAARADGNLVVLRTLSKAHALAGARIGVMIADPAVVALCRRIMAPYPLPQPCVDAAMRGLTPDALAATALRVKAIVAERARMFAALRQLECVAQVYPSQANFLTVRVADRAGIYTALRDAGIIVREVSSYPGLDGCLRITVGSAIENNAVLAVLARARVGA